MQQIVRLIVVLEHTGTMEFVQFVRKGNSK